MKLEQTVVAAALRRTDLRVAAAVKDRGGEVVMVNRMGLAK